MNVSLGEKLLAAVARNPAAPAFIDRNRVITHRQFGVFIGLAARMLHERGIRPGVVVGLTMAQSPLHCIVLFALARLGAISVPLAPSLELAAQQRLVDRYGIRRIVADRDLAGFTGCEILKIDNLTISNTDTDTDFMPFKVDAAAPFRVALSSGTTGEPKGMLLTQGYFVDRVLKTFLDDYDADTRCIPPDLHQTIALTHGGGTLLVGGSLVFPSSYDLPELAAAINVHGVTHMLLSPAKALQMVNVLPPGGIAFPTLKHLRIMGGKPSRQLLDTLRSRFTPNIYNSYGSTELGMITLATPETFASAPDSAGRLSPWAKLEVLDRDGKVLSPGQSGEIRFAIDRMPHEYFGDDAQTLEKFRDGWFYPGDIGHMSADGLLYIEGRSDNLINVGGHKVTVEYIEEKLARHPQIREVGVLLVESAVEKTQSLVAVIVPEGRPSPADLAEFGRSHLGVLAPQQFVFVAELPRNPTGKLLRDKLAGLLATGAGNGL